MTTDRHELTDADVLTFVLAGCNAREIADYAGLSKATATAWMARVTRGYGSAAA